MSRTGLPNPSMETIVHSSARKGGVEVLLKGTYQDSLRGTMEPLGLLVAKFKVECTFQGNRIPRAEVDREMARLRNADLGLKGKELLVSYDFNGLSLDKMIVCYVYTPMEPSEFGRFKTE